MHQHDHHHGSDQGDYEFRSKPHGSDRSIDSNQTEPGERRKMPRYVEICNVKLGASSTMEKCRRKRRVIAKTFQFTTISNAQLFAVIGFIYLINRPTDGIAIAEPVACGMCTDMIDKHDTEEN
jgi:hypothetical protein